MAKITGPGPWRAVDEAELTKIWYLEPATGRLFYVFPVHTSPPPGTDRPEVKPLLRRMLYIVRLRPPDFDKLVADLESAFPTRDGIAIGAHLLSSLSQIYQSPWAYPAALETTDLLHFRKVMGGVSDSTTIRANITTATPFAYAVGRLKVAAAFTAINAVYATSLINQYYSAYKEKLDTELALRGVNPNLL